MPHHAGVVFGSINNKKKIHYFLEHLLVFLQDARFNHQELILIYLACQREHAKMYGNRTLVDTDEHKISPCSIQANVSIQQQLLQGVSCNKLSLFRISDKRNNKVCI
jgi:hypothetical protein